MMASVPLSLLEAIKSKPSVVLGEFEQEKRRIRYECRIYTKPCSM